VAGVLVALDPALIVYAAELHSLTLDALANVCILCAAIALPARPTVVKLGGLGALFGVAALTRATALVLMPIYILWLHRSRAMPVARAALVIAAALLMYSPWPLHNSLLLGQVTLGSSETTEWFWRGNNPNATGGSLTSGRQRMLELAPSEFRATVTSATEAGRMAVYRDAALAFIRENPQAAAELYVTKLGTFWWGSDATGLLYPEPWLVSYRFWYVAILMMAAVGVLSGLSGAKQRSVLLLILVTVAAVSATQAIFYVEGRHRIEIEPLILILAGVGVDQLARAVLASVRAEPTPEALPIDRTPSVS
jgi:hypothetical protein